MSARWPSLLVVCVALAAVGCASRPQVQWQAWRVTITDPQLADCLRQAQREAGAQYLGDHLAAGQSAGYTILEHHQLRTPQRTWFGDFADDRMVIADCRVATDGFTVRANLDWSAKVSDHCFALPLALWDGQPFVLLDATEPDRLQARVLIATLFELDGLPVRSRGEPQPLAAYLQPGPAPWVTGQQEDSTELIRRYQSIALPAFEAIDEPIESLTKRLTQVAHQQDPALADSRIFCRIPVGNTSLRATANFRDVSLADALAAVAHAAGIGMRVEPGAWILAEWAIPLCCPETRFYPVNDDVAEAVRHLMGPASSGAVRPLLRLPAYDRLSYDRRTQRLIVYANPPELRLVESLLQVYLSSWPRPMWRVRLPNGNEVAGRQDGTARWQQGDERWQVRLAPGAAPSAVGWRVASEHHTVDWCSSSFTSADGQRHPFLPVDTTPPDDAVPAVTWSAPQSPNNGAAWAALALRPLPRLVLQQADLPACIAAVRQLVRASSLPAFAANLVVPPAAGLPPAPPLTVTFDHLALPDMLDTICRHFQVDCQVLDTVMLIAPHRQIDQLPPPVALLVSELGLKARPDRFVSGAAMRQALERRGLIMLPGDTAVYDTRRHLLWYRGSGQFEHAVQQYAAVTTAARRPLWQAIFTGNMRGAATPTIALSTLQGEPAATLALVSDSSPVFTMAFTVDQPSELTLTWRDAQHRPHSQRLPVTDLPQPWQADLPGPRHLAGTITFVQEPPVPTTLTH